VDHEGMDILKVMHTGKQLLKHTFTFLSLLPRGIRANHSFSSEEENSPAPPKLGKSTVL
jgi:hypothetical protein